MANLLITPRAEQDLEEIFYHTFFTWGIDQAEKYQDELYFAMQLILKNNTLGEVYPFGEIQYRKLHINRHLIFYRMDGANCLIIRILHDKMNPRGYLEND